MSRNPYLVTINADADMPADPNRPFPRREVREMIGWIRASTGVGRNEIRGYIRSWYYGVNCNTTRHLQQCFDNNPNYRRSLAEGIRDRILARQDSDVNTGDEYETDSDDDTQDPNSPVDRGSSPEY